MRRWYGTVGVRSPMTIRRGENGSLILSFGFGFLCRHAADWRSHA